MNKRKSKFGKAMRKFVWGEEVELGDCIFYTIFTLVIIGLIWLFTFEKWFGIRVEFSLIVWLCVTFLIWRQYWIKRSAGIKSKLDCETGSTLDDSNEM